MEIDLKSLPKFAKEYLYYLETIKGRSVTTVHGYENDLRMFFRFLKHHKIPEFANTELAKIPISDIGVDFIAEVSLADIYEFLHFVSSGRNNSAVTRSRKVSSIKGLYKYLTVKAGLFKENPAKELEVPAAKKRLPVYLTLEQSLELLTKTNSSSPLRDYCILTLFLNCGMRLSELVSINLSSIRENRLRIVGKGNKEREIHLNTACIKSIENYVANEREKLNKIVDKSALFLGKTTGRRLSARMVQIIVQKALENAELSEMGFSPHKLRHTAATLMYQHGNVDIRILKEILGHVNLGTTEIYTHISDKNVKDAINKNPLANV